MQEEGNPPMFLDLKLCGLNDELEREITELVEAKYGLKPWYSSFNNYLSLSGIKRKVRCPKCNQEERCYTSIYHLVPGMAVMFIYTYSASCSYSVLFIWTFLLLESLTYIPVEAIFFNLAVASNILMESCSLVFFKIH